MGEKLSDRIQDVFCGEYAGLLGEVRELERLLGLSLDEARRSHNMLAEIQQDYAKLKGLIQKAYHEANTK